MNTLFISTYNELVNISLIMNDNIKTICEEYKNGHSSILVPTIKKILDENNLDIHDLNEIVVVNGPGSFTGVRLGVTVSKTLAYTLNIPIKTITSIEAISLSYEEANKIIIIPDSKGKYLGKFIDNKLTDLLYLKDADYLKYIENN